MPRNTGIHEELPFAKGIRHNRIHFAQKCNGSCFWRFLYFPYNINTTNLVVLTTYTVCIIYISSVWNSRFLRKFTHIGKNSRKWYTILGEGGCVSITIDESMIPDIWHVIFRKCTPAWEMPKQRLGAHNLTYIIQGEACYTINGKPIDLTRGDLLIVPAHNVRKGITFPDRLMHCFSVDFDLRNTKNQEVILPFPIISNPGHHEDIIHLFHELSFSWMNRQPGYIIKSRGLFLQILHRFLELVVYKGDLDIEDSRIDKVIRFVTAHYSERITVKMMADMVGLHPAYFGDLFRREMGNSFNRYLTQIRVSNAENMLTSGEYKVGNIAEACGFTDTSHFYRQYKLIKGFPPSYNLPKRF